MNRSDNNHEPLDRCQAPGDLVEQVARGRRYNKVHHYYTTDRLTMRRRWHACWQDKRLYGIVDGYVFLGDKLHFLIEQIARLCGRAPKW